jgi:hypothetical protein
LDLNLLKNAGFEDGLIGWSTQGGAVTRTTNPTPHEGSQYLAGGDTPRFTVSQLVDLSLAGFVAENIDLGTYSVHFGGFQAGWNAQTDQGQIGVRFYDTSGETVGTVRLPFFYSNHTWVLQDFAALLPPSSRTVEFFFEGIRHDGSNNDAYLDDAFVRIVPVELYVGIQTLPSLATFSLGQPLELRAASPAMVWLGYQWQLNGQTIPGATNPTYVIPELRLQDAGNYSAVFLSPTTATRTQPLRIEATLPALDLVDTFANRRVFTDASGLGTTNNLAATAEAAEPKHATKRGGRSLWMTWRAPANGVATFETVGSSFDTLLAVYTGTSLANLLEVASDEDSGGFLTSRLQFNALAGTDYHLALDGFAGASGVVVLAWNLETTAPPLPLLTRQPASALAVEGAAVQFAVAAEPADLAYQWLFNDVPIPGQTAATLNLPAVSGTDAGSYRVRVTAPGPNAAVVLSDAAQLDVVDKPETAALGLSADKLEDLFADDEPLAGFAGVLQGQAPDSPRGDPRLHLAALPSALHDRELAAPVAIGVPGSQFTDNTTSTASPDDPPVCGLVTTANRWFRLRFGVPPANTRSVTLTTDGSEIASLLAVFTNRAALTLLSCDVATPPQKPAAGVAFVPQPNVDYLVLVDGLAGTRGGLRLNYGGEALESPVRVDIVRDGANLRIEYQGVLESAPTAQGPYAPVPGAPKPYVVPPGSPAQFYRSRL